MPKTLGPRATDPQVSNFVNELQGVLQKLDTKDSELFKSGIELIKLTAKVGDRVEFSVVIAGKEAPKIDVAQLDKPDSVK